MSAYVCPTLCDDDCADDFEDGIICHEGHLLPRLREHDCDECEARQRAERSLS